MWRHFVSDRIIREAAGGHTTRPPRYTQQTLIFYSALTFPRAVCRWCGVAVGLQYAEWSCWNAAVPGAAASPPITWEHLLAGSGQVARDQEMQEIAAIHLFNIPSSGLIQLLYKQAPADLNKILIWGYQ